jgi:hypothetical protein
MSAVQEMLMMEAKGIEGTMQANLEEMMPLDCLIVMRFKKKDGSFHNHYVLPAYPVACDIAQSLANMLKEEKVAGGIVVPESWLGPDDRD